MISTISLIELLKEVQGNPKAIIMAGAAGSGKSTFVSGNTEKAIEGLIQKIPELKYFTYLNPDDYIEGRKKIEGENEVGLTKASAQIDDKDVPASIGKKENFIWDTTASNAAKLIGGTYRRKEVPGLINDAKGYDFMMIMVYAHPIVSWISNFNRDRKVPKIGLISTWNNVYGNIDSYKSKLGNNFLLVPAATNEFYTKEIEAFNQAVKEGKVYEFLEDIISQDPDKYKSTFRKDDSNLSPEEKAKKEKTAEKTRELYKGYLKQLESQFEKVAKDIEEYGISQEEAVSRVKQFIA